MNTSYIKAPIMWMNSNCKAKSRRTQYMKELMKYIDVDNYGTCGEKIRQLPEHIVQIQGSRNRTLKQIATYNWEGGKLALSRDYLFTISIENSLTYDYISEKLWQPLAAGSIPIYLGAPNVYDWLPCRADCMIDLRKFKTPKDAAMFIRSVAKNKTLYESYHQWRKEPVSDKFQKILDYYARLDKIFYSSDTLNSHFSHLIRNTPIYLNLQNIHETKFSRFCCEILPEIKQNISSLHLSNKDACDQTNAFFFSFYLLADYSHLQSLDLNSSQIDDELIVSVLPLDHLQKLSIKT
ncbi:unnamed protein product [Adineta steineri]|uniref:Fucosyltransferase n=1 Tax=Adineta steineri TaxID=433720 RepID=A0A816E517_9BILA|nr:unnamed protein product [Adineta steineri]CAF1642216.1 unnamed protein product [Adineta steineri]